MCLQKFTKANHYLGTSLEPASYWPAWRQGKCITCLIKRLVSDATCDLCILCLPHQTAFVSYLWYWLSTVPTTLWKDGSKFTLDNGDVYCGTLIKSCIHMDKFQDNWWARSMWVKLRVMLGQELTRSLLGPPEFDQAALDVGIFELGLWKLCSLQHFPAVTDWIP